MVAVLSPLLLVAPPVRPALPAGARIRPILPGDAPKLERFYAELSEESRRLRFLGTSLGPGPRLTRAFCATDHAQREGFVAVAADVATGEERIVGHLCLEPDAPRSAELALAVADDWQGRGVGRRLVQRSVAWALAAGFDRLTATMFPGNGPIHRLLTSAGAPATLRQDGPTTVATIELRPARPKAA